MPWISGNVVLNVVGGRKTVTVKNLSVVNNDGGLPKGNEVNAKLANPESCLRKQVADVLANGGEVHIGRMRVMNGGGFYSVPAQAVDFGDKMLDKISLKTGKIVRAYPVVFRDMGAPGTFGVFDGGGAGRGERIPESPEDFLVKHCLSENFGEIGMVIHRTDGQEGRISYDAPLAGWLDAHIIEEWNKAHQAVPPSLAVAHASVVPNADSLIIEGVGEIGNVKIAFEMASASLECLVQSNLDILLVEGESLRFIDLESRNGNPLNRKIGIVLEAENGDLFICSFLNGKFDQNSPVLRLTDELVPDIGNEKFQAVIEMIKSR